VLFENNENNINNNNNNKSSSSAWLYYVSCLPQFATHTFARLAVIRKWLYTTICRQQQQLCSLSQHTSKYIFCVDTIQRQTRQSATTTCSRQFYIWAASCLCMCVWHIAIWMWNFFSFCVCLLCLLDCRRKKNVFFFFKFRNLKISTAMLILFSALFLFFK
jgi:hypothetical protein